MLFLHSFNQLSKKTFYVRDLALNCYSCTNKLKDQNNLKKPNHYLCNALNELANQQCNKNIYKFRAYQRAAKILNRLPQKITSGNEAKKFPGIGKNIANVIDKFLGNRNIPKLDDITKDEKHIYKKLSDRIICITPSTDKNLIDAGVIKSKNLQKHHIEINNQDKKNS